MLRFDKFWIQQTIDLGLIWLGQFSQRQAKFELVKIGQAMIQEIKDKKNTKEFYPIWYISVKIFHRGLLELIKEISKHLENIDDKN